MTSQHNARAQVVNFHTLEGNEKIYCTVSCISCIVSKGAYDVGFVAVVTLSLLAQGTEGSVQPLKKAVSERKVFLFSFVKAT